MRMLMILLLAAVSAAGQVTAKKAVPTAEETAAIVARQFGENFQVFAGFPPLVGDFDGDGVDDLAVVVACEQPYQNAGQQSYRVFLPQEDYFGGSFGETRDTTGQKWQERKMVAIIHGMGAEGWRAQQPKAKFLLLNVPFDKLAVMHVKHKKREFDSLLAEETDVTTSAIYWDGRKKYKWSPTPLSMGEFK